MGECGVVSGVSGTDGEWVVMMIGVDVRCGNVEGAVKGLAIVTGLNSQRDEMKVK